MLTLAVAAKPGDVLPLRWVIQIRETRVVELEIGAAKLSERLKLVGVDPPEVVPKFFQVGIDGSVDSGATAPVMHHARRRDGKLRRRAGHGFQELEIFTEDALFERQLADDAERAEGGFNVTTLIAELDFQAFSAPGNAADLVKKIHVPRPTAIFTVGNAPKADVLLHLHRFADGLVLNATQFGSRDTTLLMFLARLKHFFRPQEAANVIGAKRRLRAFRGILRRRQIRYFE